MQAHYHRYMLDFKRPGATSRGVLTTKETWFIIIENAGKKGIGECSIFRGLSVDDQSNYETKLRWVCKNINLGLEKLLMHLTKWPSIQFGIEQAYRSFKSDNSFELFSSAFTKGKGNININGLVWMGSADFMCKQIKDKIAKGFRCIKLKIGAIEFKTELQILKSVRKEFSPNDIEIRVDANGAFSLDSALEQLKQLSEYKLHSIEQPIKPKQIEDMARLCEQSPLPIALDEELIGIYDATKKAQLLQMVKPKYIVLKPSLIGGYFGSKEWIMIAEKNQINWWITSALESNVGLNAIAQWTYTLGSDIPQGLGTGNLFTNNIASSLEVKHGKLIYNTNKKWHFNF